jgi:hypothetical protein
MLSEYRKHRYHVWIRPKGRLMAAVARGGYGRQDGGEPKKKRLDARGRVLRRGRTLGRLKRGLYAYDDVAREEELTTERVREIMREALAERSVDDETDHAKLQWRRLAPAMQIAGHAVADGEGDPAIPQSAQSARPQPAGRQGESGL